MVERHICPDFKIFNMGFVYILQSVMNGSYYIGSCGNIDRRLIKHNKGLVQSTRRYRPWVLVYSEKYETLVEAKKREKQIKLWKKRRAIASLISSKNF